MIPKDCKRLAEADFPIAEVSRHAMREKRFPVPRGLPSTLHVWWARRPLASSRAMLLGLLWPDPCDPQCPSQFKDEARKRLREVAGCNPGTTDEDLRKALLRFIADFSNWDNAVQRTYLEVSRALLRSAHAPADGGAYEPPLVMDPFAGGGSIPLEALRLGCETFASDLNPVACLILKVMLEDFPRHGAELAEGLRRVGATFKQEAERELNDLYPRDPDGATPIAYLWARTVRCESPHCGAEIPLVRSFWIARKAGRRKAFRYSVQRPQSASPLLHFEIFTPTADAQVPRGTVSRARATCPCCSATLTPDRVRAQLIERRGGADVVFDEAGRRTGGARLMSVALVRRGVAGRHYRLPTDGDYDAVYSANQRLRQAVEGWARNGKQGLCPVPDEPLGRVPVAFGVINVWVYGMCKWGDLFTARQNLALITLCKEIRALCERNGPGDDVVARSLALVLGKIADFNCSLSSWRSTSEDISHLFGRQALPMVWDFAETIPIYDDYVNIGRVLKYINEVMLATVRAVESPGHVQRANAAAHPMPSEAASVWFTDPPYYDSVPYAYIADFFYVWLRRSIGKSMPELFPDILCPKTQEIVAYIEEGGSQETAYTTYEARMAEAFSEGRRILRDDGVGAVVFAHKTTEGWEALLSGMTKGGWVITGSWPIATEMASRLRARESAALATSVHLICRPRPDEAGVGDWADVLRELPNRVGDWMERLQGEGVRGADLVFACIGPALEIFSRYIRVETADGREVGLPEYLEKVWEVVGRSALAQVLGTSEATARNGAAGAVEEDARLTALFLWTLQSTDGETADAASDEGEDEEPSDEDDDEEDSARGKVKGFTLVFDVVRRFAQPLGIDLTKWEGRVIKTTKGVVRLLPIAERAKQLFGEDGAQAVAARLEQGAVVGTNPLQGMLFPDLETAPSVRGRRRGRGTLGGVEVSDERLAAAREATTLDRVHAAMLLQAGGRTNALRALLKAEQERGPDFLRLANALAALYPKGSEEKRLLEAMLQAVRR